MAEKVLQLKQEVERIANSICEEDDFEEETLVDVIKILSSLTELRFKKKRNAVSSLEKNAGSLKVPFPFKCPISDTIMYDSVILVSGQTYDRPNIQKWLDNGNLTCPNTKQFLKNLDFTPNILVHNMILNWCEETENAQAHLARIQKPTLAVDDVNTHADAGRDYLYSLLDQMSDSFTECCEAVRELRQLTKTEPFIRKLFGVSKPLVSQLANKKIEMYTLRDLAFEEDLITTIFNIAIHEANKKKVAENLSVMYILSYCLDPEVASTSVAKRNAAAALFTLSTLNSNKVIIKRSSALFNMITSLGERDAVPIKEIVSVIISLCSISEYKVDTIHFGVVPIIIEDIINNRFVDELLPLLSLLSYHRKAVADLKQFHTMPWLVRILSKSSCEPTKEHAMVVLFDMCYRDRTLLKKIVSEPDGFDALRKLTESGTWRAKSRANSILVTLRNENKKR